MSTLYEQEMGDQMAVATVCGDFKCLFMIWDRRAAKTTIPYCSAKFCTDMRLVFKLGVRIALVIMLSFDVGMAIVP